MVTETVTDGELHLARQGALSAARSGRGIVSTDDLIQEANMWIVSHMSKVLAWREEGRHGQNKLRQACRQFCLNVVARERRKQSGLQPGDLHYYTPAMLMELLPSIWNTDDWVSSQAIDSGELKGPSRPAEGNNRLAMICDVRSAFYGLSKEDQGLLVMLYHGPGLPYDRIGELLEVHERTVRRREARVLDKMVERLGGEPPWKR